MKSKMAFSLLILLSICIIGSPLKGEAKTVEPQAIPVFADIWADDSTLTGTGGKPTDVHLRWGGGSTLTYNVYANYGNGLGYERSSTSSLKHDEETYYYLPTNTSKKTFYLNLSVRSSGDSASASDTVTRRLY